MTELFRDILAMTGREKEATVTANIMQHGLRRLGLHDFCSSTPQLINQTTFTEMACDEIRKMKTKFYETKATSPRPNHQPQSLSHPPLRRGMTHNDVLKRTPHPERGGGSNASPGV